MVQHLAGATVLVRNNGTLGWVGRVRSQTGSVVTVITDDGRWRMVDVLRVEVRAI